MNELIPLIHPAGKPAVSARELYRFLEMRAADFSRWAKSNILENPFAVEGEDWMRLRTDAETPTGGKIEREDYALTLPFAKKLAMASKSSKGEQVRNYFLACEKAAMSAARPKPRKTLPHQTPEWLEARQETKGKRKTFTGILAAHGCKNEAFSIITNSVYVPLFGHTASEIKTRAGLCKSAATREHMTATALLAIGLTEAVSAERIEAQQVQGGFRCQEVTQGIAANIAKAIGGKFNPLARLALTNP